MIVYDLRVTEMPVGNTPQAHQTSATKRFPTKDGLDATLHYSDIRIAQWRAFWAGVIV